MYLNHYTFFLKHSRGMDILIKHCYCVIVHRLHSRNKRSNIYIQIIHRQAIIQHHCVLMNISAAVSCQLQLVGLV